MKNEDFNALVAKAINLTIAQGSGSIDGEVCVYLNPQGLRCVIGQILPEDTLAQVMDDTPNASVERLVLSTDWGSQFDDEQRAALMKLQMCHDQAAKSCSFVQKFKLEVFKEGFVWK
jgi:hypothetical protein